MKIGIIAEFNPLHTGHVHLINTVKSQYPSASIYIIMSTYFTQRGEPSFIDPYHKVQLALAVGADFIFELPPVFSTQRADIFASGAISICQKLELDALAFGVENIDFFTQFKQTDSSIISPSQPFLQRIHTFNLEQSKNNDWQSSANNILAHFYIKAAKNDYPNLQFIPIQRQGAHFSETHLNTKFASASAIRQAIQRGNFDDITAFLPYQSALLASNLTWQNLFFPFLHTLHTHPNLSQFATVGNSGLDNRMKHATHLDTFDTFMESVKTRAYTRTSIQRAMLFILLNITQQELDTHTQTAYSIPPRLIGMNKMKSNELKSISHIHHLHEINQPDYIETIQKFEKIYHLHIKKESVQHFPFIFDENMA